MKKIVTTISYAIIALMSATIAGCSQYEEDAIEWLSNPHVVPGDYVGNWMVDGNGVGQVNMKVTETSIEFKQFPVDYLISLVREENNDAPWANQPVNSIEGPNFLLSYYPEDPYYKESYYPLFDMYMKSWYVRLGSRLYRLDLASNQSQDNANLEESNGTFTLPVKINGIAIVDLETTETFTREYESDNPLKMILTAHFNIK